MVEQKPARQISHKLNFRRRLNVSILQDNFRWMGFHMSRARFLAKTMFVP